MRRSKSISGLTADHRKAAIDGEHTASSLTSLPAGTRQVNTYPDIRLVITDYYKGAINDVIYAIIRNVDKVLISIRSPNGKEIESGPASQSSGVWSYRTAVPNPDFPGAKILITAEDLQGNRAEEVAAIF